MAQTLSISKSFSTGGKNYAENTNLTSDTNINVEIACPAAQPGCLSVRSNSTAGNLTMTNANHGIATGNYIDIYFPNNANTTHNWGGIARYALAGNVSGTTVPFTLATGDVLPAANAAIVAGIVQVANQSITGNNALAIVSASDAQASAVVTLFATSTEELYMPLAQGCAYEYISTDAGAPVNPIANQTITAVHMSSGDTTQAQNVRISLMMND